MPTPTSLRRALVTGGSGELGGAIAQALAGGGYHVIVHANRSLHRAEAVVGEIVAGGGSAQATAFDVSDAEVTRAALDVLLGEGCIHAVVNNAGIHDDAPMAGMSSEQWHRVIDVSLHGFFNVTQPLLLPMARARFGRIVSISSVAALLGNRGQTNYAAAKAALHGASKSLARERIRELVPAQRAGTPEDVAALVAFLCSEAAGYINGQVIGVNGGMA